MACATQIPKNKYRELRAGGKIVMREFFRQWRENWTWVDNVMASLTACMFVTSLELSVLRLVL